MEVSEAGGWKSVCWIGCIQIYGGKAAPPAPQAFTAVLVHTDDNNPPQWLVYAVAPAGHSANFSVQVGVLLYRGGEEGGFGLNTQLARMHDVSARGVSSCNIGIASAPVQSVTPFFCMYVVE